VSLQQPLSLEALAAGRVATSAPELVHARIDQNMTVASAREIEIGKPFR
jgi:hypothetical protein